MRPHQAIQIAGTKSKKCLSEHSSKQTSNWPITTMPRVHLQPDNQLAILCTCQIHIFMDFEFEVMSGTNHHFLM